MNKAGIFIEIDGEPTDFSEVDWFLKAPCGCVSGATVGYSDHFGRIRRTCRDEKLRAMRPHYDAKRARQREERAA